MITFVSESADIAKAPAGEAVNAVIEGITSALEVSRLCIGQPDPVGIQIKIISNQYEESPGFEGAVNTYQEKDLHGLERDLAWSGAGGIEPRYLDWKPNALPLS